MGSRSSAGARRPAAISCRIHLQRVVAIACALREGEGFTSGRSASPETASASSIQRFFDGIEKYTPQLVSWNGGGFDLPVLHYRALIHGVARRATGTWAKTTATSSATTTWAATTRATST